MTPSQLMKKRHVLLIPLIDAVCHEADEIKIPKKHAKESLGLKAPQDSGFGL